MTNIEEICEKNGRIIILYTSRAGKGTRST